MRERLSRSLPFILYLTASIWLAFCLEEWLFSDADPYPYAASLAKTGAALALFLLALNLSGGKRTGRPKRDRIRRFVWFLAAGSIFALTLTGWHLVLRARVLPLAQANPPDRFIAFTPIAAISQPMQDATVAMEDGHFYQHHGFDWAAMHRAPACGHAGRADRAGRQHDHAATGEKPLPYARQDAPAQD